MYLCLLLVSYFSVFLCAVATAVNRDVYKAYYMYDFVIKRIKIMAGEM